MALVSVVAPQVESSSDAQGSQSDAGMNNVIDNNYLRQPWSAFMHHSKTSAFRKCPSLDK